VSERINELKHAIETAHNCAAWHVASESVIESLDGEDAWEVAVETFRLVGHPKARRCHAWCYDENGQTRYVTVLELPPIDSAESAVKTIAERARC
jgi:hypothetical protein